MQKSKLTNETATKLIDEMAIKADNIAQKIKNKDYLSCEEIAMNELRTCVDLMQLVSEYMQFFNGDTKSEIENTNKFIRELLESILMYSKICASAVLVARAKMIQQDERQKQKTNRQGETG